MPPKPTTSKFKPPAPSKAVASTNDEFEDDPAKGAPEPHSQADPGPQIPQKLLTRLLHESFLDANTRVSKDASAAVGKYMETFVREAIARAVIEKKEGGDGFLEVEDLEKIAPQLLLDF
ncbi:MAG: hypothetical protein M1824_001201 [Vezdaea acicularis]|nr:MAG: hypothetical protein M1824_001201 [Vezdaea acicularis]